MTRMAQRLHISQSSLSKQMKELETELGKKLFLRGNYNVRLTDEGMLLRKRSEDILDMVGKTEEEFKALSGITGGDVRIGCAESDGIKHLARRVKSLQERYPRFRLHLYSGNTEDVEERLYCMIRTTESKLLLRQCSCLPCVYNGCSCIFFFQCPLK